MQSVDGAPYQPLIALTPQAMTANGLASLVIAETVIPNLQAWGRADQVNQGTWPALTGMPDLTGLGSRDLTAVGAPTIVANSINGRPGVSCVPGTPTYMSNAASLPMGDRGPRTVFFVGKCRSPAGGYQVSFRVAAGAFLSAHRNSAGTIFAHLGGSGDNQTLTGLPAISGIPHIWEHHHDGRQGVGGADSAARVVIDGVDQGITAGGFAVAETGTAGWAVGSFPPDTANGWDGEFSEYIIFNRQLSWFEIYLVRSYLSSWYGLAVNNKVMTMNFGDSTAYGSGDGTTIAAGGYRQALYALHPNLQTVGTFYTPKGGDASFQRCEGNVGFNSGTNPATGIGGGQLTAMIAAHRPQLVTLQIGENDAALSLFTAAQTGVNVRNIADQIYAASPDTRIIVARAIKQTSAFPAVNAIIVAQAAQIELNLGPNGPGGTSPNVLACGPGGTRCLIPPDALLPDSLYADTLHLSVAGNAIVVANMWHPALMAAGY